MLVAEATSDPKPPYTSLSTSSYFLYIQWYKKTQWRNPILAQNCFLFFSAHIKATFNVVDVVVECFFVFYVHLMSICVGVACLPAGRPVIQIKLAHTSFGGQRPMGPMRQNVWNICCKYLITDWAKNGADWWTPAQKFELWINNGSIIYITLHTYYIHTLTNLYICWCILYKYYIHTYIHTYIHIRHTYIRHTFIRQTYYMRTT